jgi:CSLREA domain-containing protein
MRRASTAVLCMSFITLLLAGLPQGALAAEFTVNTTADGSDSNLADAFCDADPGTPGQQCTLRAAIEQTNAQPGPDTVILPAGTYTIDSPTFPHHTVSDDLIIDGGGAATTTVNQDEANRIFEVAAGVKLDLRDVTVRDGVLAAPGGGIINHGTLILRRSTVKGNTAFGDDGGGIYASATATRTAVIDSVIGTPGLPNVALGAGADNPGGRGGGIGVEGGRLDVRRSLVEANEANEDTVFNVNGGGLYVQNTDDPVTIMDSTLRGNKANEGSGGGISYNDFGEDASLLIEGSTLSGNQANPCGGGIEGGGTSMTIVNSTISGNTTGNSGGGLCVEGAEIVHTTIAGNSSGFSNGIRARGSDTTTITGSILDNPGFNANCGEDPGATIASGGSNIDSGSSCGFPPGQSNIDPLLRGLKDNGGPTFTRALRPASPAIDAAAGGTAPARDQRGVPRGPDIGAYELARCGGLIVNRVGTSGRDELQGTSGLDGFLLFGGRDTAAGRGGKDAICGGPGSDTLRGGVGNDRLYGGPGSDLLVGGPGTGDLCVGGPGPDRLRGCERREG